MFFGGSALAGIDAEARDKAAASIQQTLMCFMAVDSRLGAGTLALEKSAYSFDNVRFKLRTKPKIPATSGPGLPQGYRRFAWYEYTGLLERCSELVFAFFRPPETCHGLSSSGLFDNEGHQYLLCTGLSTARPTVPLQIKRLETALGQQ